MSPKSPEEYYLIREKSKEKIMQTALALFSSVGYLNTSVSKIAKKAGVSKGLMYNYFDSKEHLLESVMGGFYKMVDSVFGVDESLPADVQLKLIMTKFFETVEKREEFIRMIFPLAIQVGKYGFANKMFAVQYFAGIKKVENILKQMDYTNPYDESIALAAMMEGGVLHKLLLGDQYPWDDFRRKLLKKYGLLGAVYDSDGQDITERKN